MTLWRQGLSLLLIAGLSLDPARSLAQAGAPAAPAVPPAAPFATHAVVEPLIGAQWRRGFVPALSALVIGLIAERPSSAQTATLVTLPLWSPKPWGILMTALTAITAVVLHRYGETLRPNDMVSTRQSWWQALFSAVLYAKDDSDAGLSPIDENDLRVNRLSHAAMRAEKLVLSRLSMLFFALTGITAAITFLDVDAFNRWILPQWPALVLVGMDTVFWAMTFRETRAIWQLQRKLPLGDAARRREAEDMYRSLQSAVPKHDPISDIRGYWRMDYKPSRPRLRTLDRYTLEEIREGRETELARVKSVRIPMLAESLRPRALRYIRRARLVWRLDKLEALYKFYLWLSVIGLGLLGWMALVPNSVFVYGNNLAIAAVTIVGGSLLPVLRLSAKKSARRWRSRSGLLAITIAMSILYAWTLITVPAPFTVSSPAIPQPRAATDSHPARAFALSRSA